MKRESWCLGVTPKRVLSPLRITRLGENAANLTVRDSNEFVNALRQPSWRYTIRARSASDWIRPRRTGFQPVSRLRLATLSGIGRSATHSQPKHHEGDFRYKHKAAASGFVHYARSVQAAPGDRLEACPTNLLDPKQGWRFVLVCTFIQ